ncbi:MAG: dephospho-CoA kinase [Candidatus Omnitrophica bacterium]|nr:dephospho-CoA kinase [Candidatus Omnitrophota bacterium]
MGRKKIIIGITGGLAAGKTTVAGMLAEKGALKIDADRIGHQILEENKAVRRMIIDSLGKGILSGGDIDRRKLRKKVFSDRKSLEKIERLLHPLIVRRIREEIGCHSEGTILIDAPLLLETGLNKIVDLIVVIKADSEAVTKRAADRGFSEQDAKNIIARQMPLSDKLRLADYVIDNSGNLNRTKKGVDKLWKRIQEL